MKNLLLKEKVYEVEFDQLNSNKDIEKLDSKKTILNAEVELSVIIGSCKKSIQDVLSFKNGDLVMLDKPIDKGMDIHVNDKNIATGESVIIDDKLAVRISKFTSL